MGAVHLVFLAALIALNEIETTSSNLRLQFIPLAWCAIELFQVRVALLPTVGEEESSTASRWWGLASNLLLLSLDIYFIYEYLYFNYWRYYGKGWQWDTLLLLLIVARGYLSYFLYKKERNT